MYIHKRTHSRQNRNKRRLTPINRARRRTRVENVYVPTIEQIVHPPTKVVVHVNGLEDEFGTSIMNILDKAEIHAAALLTMSDDDILAIKGIGKGKLATIRGVIDARQ